MATNSTQIVSEDPYVAYFKAIGGFSIPLVTMHGILSIVRIFVLFSNSALIYITAKSKSLHGRCNYLLALNSFGASLLQLGLFVKFFLLITAINFIPLRTCYWLLCLPMAGAAIQTTSQLCIGLDRLLSVLFPFWYRNGDKAKSIILLNAFCAIRTGFISYLYFYAANSQPERPVMCGTGDISQPVPEIVAFVYQELMILYSVEFCCYLLVWMVIYCRKSFDVLKTKKLMKSLTIILAITLVGYVLGTLWRVILPYVHFNLMDVEYYVTFPTNLLFAIASGSNLPILIKYSAEYQQAFREHFAWIFRMNSTVSANPTMPVENNNNHPNPLHNVQTNRRPMMMTAISA